MAMPINHTHYLGKEKRKPSGKENSADWATEATCQFLPSGSTSPAGQGARKHTVIDALLDRTQDLHGKKRASLMASPYPGVKKPA